MHNYAETDVFQPKLVYPPRAFTPIQDRSCRPMTRNTVQHSLRRGASTRLYVDSLPCGGHTQPQKRDLPSVAQGFKAIPYLRIVDVGCSGVDQPV